MRMISAIFKGEAITAGFGKLCFSSMVARP
jgi:hypothetical protein